MLLLVIGIFLAGSSLAFAIGLQVSGIQNPELTLFFWVFSAGLFTTAIILVLLAGCRTAYSNFGTRTFLLGGMVAGARTGWRLWSNSRFVFTTEPISEVKQSNNKAEYKFERWREHDGMWWQVFIKPGRQIADLFVLHGPHCSVPSCLGLLYQKRYKQGPKDVRTERGRVETDVFPFVCTVCAKEYRIPKHSNGLNKSLNECEDELSKKLDAEYLVWKSKQNA